MTDRTTNDDDLRPDELVPAAGGEWSGLLFDNPAIGLAPQLTWSFTFPFAEVPRSYGSSPVSLDIEWLPIPSRTWCSMAGQRLASARFAEPGEASVYFFEHHRYDTIDLQLVDQRNTSVQATATVSGDIDGLGVDAVHAEAWLTFTGIWVSLSDVTSPDAALARLNKFTDTAGLGLLRDHSGSSLRFIPQPS